MNEDKIKKDNAKSFPKEIYQNLPVDDMILYAVYSLERKNIEKTFPNIVVECFKLFPYKFALQGYPQYPDSVIPDRPLRKMSESSNIRRYLDGGRGTEYKITDWGWKHLNEIKDILELGKEYQEFVNKKIGIGKYKMGKVLRQIEKHPLYRRYLQSSGNIDIPETLLRDLLFATMETSERKLRENMKTLIEYCEDLGSTDIKKFLKFCISKHEEIFKPNKIKLK